MAEITRSGLQSVDPGQRLAAKALGMTAGQTFADDHRAAGDPHDDPADDERVHHAAQADEPRVGDLAGELLTVTSQDIAVNFRFAELYAAATVYYLVLVSVLMVLQSRPRAPLPVDVSRAAGRPGRIRRPVRSLGYAHDAR